MIFTDAHSGSSVCTPTRYALLTGRYNWRSRLKKGVLMGYSPRLIEPDRMTVADLLRKQGYHTSCVGKWHLGMDWPEGGNRFTTPIMNGPTAVGFDHFRGISASLDMPPYVYINDDLPMTVPTVTTGAFGRKGLAAEGLDPSDVLPDLTDHAVGVIQQQAAAAKEGRPFFLYFPLPAPHTPIAPTKEWIGKSGLNKYGDFVMQVDATVGRIMQALKDHGVRDNTLIIFTADNGCSPAAGIPDMQAKGHYPNHHFRGHKADIFEGGHRVPFIVRWPGKVKPGCDFRSTHLPHRSHGHLCRHHRHGASPHCRRGQRQHAARASRDSQAATARSGRPPFHRRSLRHPQRQVETRFLSRLRRLERPARARTRRECRRSNFTTSKKTSRRATMWKRNTRKSSPA